MENNINNLIIGQYKNIKIDNFVFALLCELKNTKDIGKIDKIINTVLRNNKRCICTKNRYPGNNEHTSRLKVPPNIEITNWLGDERRYYIDVDKCLITEIKYLWAQGIPTIGCCCGHNKTIPYIIVSPQYRIKMLALNYINQLHPKIKDRNGIYFPQQLNGAKK